MQTDILIMSALAIFDLIATALFLYIMFYHYKDTGKNLFRRSGLVILMVGIFYQALQSGLFAITQTMPLYTDFPLWMLKDIGATIWVYGYILQKREENEKTK